MTNKKQSNKCGKCTLNVSSGQKGLQCDVCNEWTHVRCMNMSEKSYDMYNEDKELNWVCKKCVSDKIDQGALSNIMKEMKEELNVVREEIKEKWETKEELKEVKKQIQNSKTNEKSERAELISIIEEMKEEKEDQRREKAELTKIIKELKEQNKHLINRIRKTEKYLETKQKNIKEN